MNRLQSELKRLYLPGLAALPGAAPAASHLIDAGGMVRALVLELARPANWNVLSAVWRGVQTDLDLPAPAIAVSGMDGLQLWFSLSAQVSASRAHEFLESLRLRYLPDVAAERVRLMPATGASALRQDLGPRLVPAQQAPTGNWSAFVAPDLAPVFADTPWLDIPPGEEGQAGLLSRVESIKPAAFEAALERLRPVPLPPEREETGTSLPSGALPCTAPEDPRRFLMRVMNDETVALALRIEAAKALLPFAEGHFSGQGT